MPQEYIDIYAAKDRVFSALREGIDTFSGLLVKTQLPENILHTVLRLLESEHKVQPVAEAEDPVYALPPSGQWSFARK